jgi:predicted outer membrane repeat protein
MSGGSFHHNNSISGGGIFAYANDNVYFNRVIFSENNAINEGGAIRAAFSTINLEANHFLRNESDERGGAISLSDGSELTLKRNVSNCINSLKCNLFEGNLSKLGGAIYMWRSQIDISTTYFENNRANIGTTIYSENGSNSKIEGSFFTHNGNNAIGGFNDQNVISSYDTSEMIITYSTFSDNNALFDTFNLEETANIFLYSSIIYDPSSNDVFGIKDQATYNVNCLIVHEADSFDASDTETIVAEPMFIDAANGNYHLNAVFSPAVDYCTDSLAMAQYQDIDGENRGYDDSTVNNGIGPFDIGADETYDNDIVFKNGFE